MDKPEVATSADAAGAMSSASSRGTHGLSSTEIGDSFELVVFEKLRDLVESNKFFFPKERCTIHKKKKYFSRDRNAYITVDIAIECRLPDEDEYSLLVVVECKDVARPVSVDDVEEFFAKVSQITGLNVKAIIATRRNFQAGALEYARSKCIAYLRFIDRTNCKWVLKRSPSLGVSGSVPDSQIVYSGLTSENENHRYLDLYSGFGSAYATTFFGLLRAMFRDEFEQGLLPVPNTFEVSKSSIPFLRKESIEDLARGVLQIINPVESPVTDLAAICAHEKDCNGLALSIGLNKNLTVGNAIGSISFEPLEIWVQSITSELDERARFTLAHELGHHFLGHALYLVKETSAVEDLIEESASPIDDQDLRRLEWQANHFASCLLMPRSSIESDFSSLAKRLGLADKGFGALYVDGQSCNLNSYYLISGQLMQRYRVSRQAVTYRLVDLGLIRDARTVGQRHFLADAVSHLFRDE